MRVYRKKGKIKIIREPGEVYIVLDKTDKYDKINIYKEIFSFGEGIKDINIVKEEEFEEKGMIKIWEDYRTIEEL